MTEEEFKNSVLPHHKLMLAEALHILRDRDEALDCLQDVITSLWKFRKNLREVENMRAYCLTAISNRAIEMIRLYPPEESESDNNIPADDKTDAFMERSEKVALLRKAISQLPENERKVIVMKAIKGMSGEEIAKATGLSHSNVRVLIHRARTKLKEYLEKYDGI